MVELVLPDSNFYINRARAGLDPFVELAAHADDWEFATCGMVVLEVCRGRSDPNLLKRFQERFGIMLYVAAGNSVWERAGQPVTREEILEKIWGVPGHASTRSVDNFVVKLRKKIEESPDKPTHILTVYGTGYKLAP